MPTACALVLASVLTAAAPSAPALEADLDKAPPAAPSAAAPTATKVLPELYALGLKPRVATSFPLLRTRRDDAETVAKLRAGSTITLLATDGGWYLVQSETRLLGWARAGTLAKSLEVMKKAGVPDKRGQLLVLQLRLRAVMGATPDESHAPWLPSDSGLILQNESAGTHETYHLCPDGRGALAFLVDDHTKYGTWTLDGDTLKLELTRETRREGVGEPVPMPEGQEGLPTYSEYKDSEEAIEESASLLWAEVLEDLKNPSPSFFTPIRGTPTCR
ncbi:SH3 domain-containing protein [Pyxidicoccus trucidator]|uniref:SH3 domain-containing protein n=1 Tax=Pyxidicoccus trucidator TaxID=2709662 RepID=UPI0013DCC25A|nr:SH3 domain-containing protein [Pyxidicoccus trucidator]